MTTDIQPWQTLAARELLDCRPWLRVSAERVRLPNGHEIDAFYHIDMPEWAQIFAVTADGRVETIGGAISLTGSAMSGSILELQSHAGAIDLSLDPRRSPLLDLSSRAGPVLGDKLTGAATNGQLVARSFKGRITVRARFITP